MYEEAVRQCLRVHRDDMTDTFVIRNHVTGNQKVFTKAEVKDATDTGTLLELFQGKRWDIERSAVEHN